MNNELYHFGIPGMKWGVRRYQNKDGTLTAAGAKRLQELNYDLEGIARDNAVNQNTKGFKGKRNRSYAIKKYGSSYATNPEYQQELANKISRDEYKMRSKLLKQQYKIDKQNKRQDQSSYSKQNSSVEKQERVSQRRTRKLVIGGAIVSLLLIKHFMNKAGEDASSPTLKPKTEQKFLESNWFKETKKLPAPPPDLVVPTPLKARPKPKIMQRRQGVKQLVAPAVKHSEGFTTNELYHWGIKGMKWGIRRYQNEDGTLTEAGKKRYNESEGKTSTIKDSKPKTKTKAKAKATSPISKGDKSKEDKSKDNKSKDNKPKSTSTKYDDDDDDRPLKEYLNKDGTLTEEGKKRYYRITGNEDYKEEGKVFGAKDLRKLEAELRAIDAQQLRAKEYVEKYYAAQQEKYEKQQLAKKTQPYKDFIKVSEDTNRLIDNTLKLLPEQKPKKLRTTSYSSMTDQELISAINRLNNENKYAELRGDYKYIKTGKQYAREALQTAGALVGVAGSVAALALTITQIKTQKEINKQKG